MRLKKIYRLYCKKSIRSTRCSYAVRTTDQTKRRIDFAADELCHISTTTTSPAKNKIWWVNKKLKHQKLPALLGRGRRKKSKNTTKKRQKTMKTRSWTFKDDCCIAGTKHLVHHLRCWILLGGSSFLCQQDKLSDMNGTSLLLYFAWINSRSSLAVKVFGFEAAGCAFGFWSDLSDFPLISDLSSSEIFTSLTWVM